MQLDYCILHYYYTQSQQTLRCMRRGARNESMLGSRHKRVQHDRCRCVDIVNHWRYL